MPENIFLRAAIQSFNPSNRAKTGVGVTSTRRRCEWELVAGVRKNWSIKSKSITPTPILFSRNLSMPEHDLRSVAFPTLGESQITELARCTGAALTAYRAGQKLFEAGDRDFNFFVIKSGEIEIIDESGDTPKTITIHKPGEFTGDGSHLSGRPSPVSAVARTNCEVYEVSPQAVRTILNRCPDLGDIILRAFIARRQLLRESGEFIGLRVIGSRYSLDTFRIRDFLAKNRTLFTWLHLETDPGVSGTLNHFRLTPADYPVFTWGHKLLLRNPSNAELADALGLRRPLEQTTYDLVVVGAGPAGLAAAGYAASPGRRTLVLGAVSRGGPDDSPL